LLLTSITSTSSHPNIIQFHSAACSNSIHATVFHGGVAFELEWITIEVDTWNRSDTVRTISGLLFTSVEGVYLWLLWVYITICTCQILMSLKSTDLRVRKLNHIS
jgi:hypothetical protein